MKMKRWKLTFSTSIAAEVEAVTLVALGFTVVQNGKRIELSNYRDTGEMEVPLPEFFRRLREYGVEVEEE
jgi:low affinity Fe/Cu permease